MSIEDKINLIKNMEPLKKASMAIEIARPAKELIEKACKELESTIDSPEFSKIDEEIRAAIKSVYHILETANVGLNDKSVVGLFS